MKKVLFYVGALALMTSCVQDELESLGTQDKKTEGITFETVTLGSRMQWEDGGTTYNPFWNAEMDRVGIYAVNVKRGYTSSTGVWEETILGDGYDMTIQETQKSLYKATKSEKDGQFTAVNDDHLLTFNDDKPAHFFAVYPSTVKATFPTNAQAKGLDAMVKLGSLPSLASQTSDLGGNNPAMLMYAAASATQEETYESVGEKVALKYEIPLSAIVFSSKNSDKYTVAPASGGKSVFGNLKDITIEAKGYDADGKGVDETKGDIKPSLIAYGSSQTTALYVDTLDFTKSQLVSTTTLPASADDSTKIILTINDEWNDKALAVAAVRNVTRKDVFSEEKPETFHVTYNFENISLLAKVQTVTVDFDGFLEFPALDVEADYKYLLTNGTTAGQATTGRTLIVNEGTFAEIFDKDGKIKWGTSTISPEEVSELYINIELTEAELAMVAKFTALTSVELNENTTIPAGTFNAAIKSTLATLRMPKVTEIAEKFISTFKNDGSVDAASAFASLTELTLPAYGFESAEVNKAFFNDDVKAKLVTLDISAVETMNAVFGNLRSLSFAGYAKLETVKVNAKGVEVSANAFAGCTALKTITGVLDLTTGESVLEMTSESKNSKLESVSIKGTEIPANAFKNCTALKNVLMGTAQVAPTAVGASAFEGCVKVEYMDLTNTKTIGAAAFSGCSALAGPAKNEPIMKVGVEKVEANIFAGTTELQMVNFTDATAFAGDAAFKNSGVKQINFAKAFTAVAKEGDSATDAAWDEDTFGDAHLYTVKAQEYFKNTTTISLPITYKEGTTVKTSSTDITVASFNRVN